MATLINVQVKSGLRDTCDFACETMSQAKLLHWSVVMVFSDFRVVL